jgi:hypothetical protein
MKLCGLGDLNMITKQNKLPSFIDRLIRFHRFWYYHAQWGWVTYFIFIKTYACFAFVFKWKCLLYHYNITIWQTIYLSMLVLTKFQCIIKLIWSILGYHLSDVINMELPCASNPPCPWVSTLLLWIWCK